MENLVTTYIVAGAVLEKDGKYLLVQEKQAKAYGLWNLPAGRVEVGDSIESTAVKEVKEETGFDIELGKKLFVHQDSAKEPPQHAFVAKIVGGKLEFPKNELLNAHWFTLDEIQSMKDKLRGRWVLRAIKQTASPS